MDITGERGVEAVCFADTRGSQVEIVQNIGRALRLNKDGSTKVARIIVPVFLEPGEDPTDMVASFRPLVAVLQGLRSHDERLVEQLTSRALTSGKRTVHIRRDENGQIVGADGEGDGEGDGQDQEQDDTDGGIESSRPRFRPFRSGRCQGRETVLRLAKLVKRGRMWTRPDVHVGFHPFEDHAS